MAMPNRNDPLEPWADHYARGDAAGAAGALEAARSVRAALAGPGEPGALRLPAARAAVAWLRRECAEAAAREADAALEAARSTAARRVRDAGVALQARVIRELAEARLFLPGGGW
jgi:hypothetical protein